MRMAFNSIYYVEGFSLKHLALIIRSISIILIVGLPFVVIRILLAYARMLDVDDVWYYMSPYSNLKLLIRDGEIIRNMKKSLIEGGKVCKEVIGKAGPIKEGLIVTDKVTHKVTHAVSYIGGIGILATTKDQGHDDALVIRENGNFIYAQGFGNNKIIPKEEIRNNVLCKLLDSYSGISAIRANSHILKMSSNRIMFNDNKQEVKILDSRQLNESKELITRCGGISSVDEAFNYKVNVNKLLANAQKMLYDLSNAEPSSIPKKYVQNKEVHDLLTELEKTNSLSGESELLKIKIKIDSIINKYM